MSADERVVEDVPARVQAALDDAERRRSVWLNAERTAVPKRHAHPDVSSWRVSIISWYEELVGQQAEFVAILDQERQARADLTRWASNDGSVPYVVVRVLAHANAGMELYEARQRLDELRTDLLRHREQQEHEPAATAAGVPASPGGAR